MTIMIEDLSLIARIASGISPIFQVIHFSLYQLQPLEKWRATEDVGVN